MNIYTWFYTNDNPVYILFHMFFFFFNLNLLYESMWFYQIGFINSMIFFFFFFLMFLFISPLSGYLAYAVSCYHT